MVSDDFFEPLMMCCYSSGFTAHVLSLSHNRLCQLNTEDAGDVMPSSMSVYSFKVF